MLQQVAQPAGDIEERQVLWRALPQGLITGSKAGVSLHMGVLEKG